MPSRAAVRSLLVILFSVTVFTGTVFFATFYFFQQNPPQFRIGLEKLGSRLLNRELKIGEILELDLGWDTFILARNITLANPEWAQEPDFARVGRVLIRLSIPSLWRDGPVLINELQLDDFQFCLLGAGEHPANWEFWPQKTGAGGVDSKKRSKEGVNLAFPVRIVDGRVANGGLVYRDSGRDIQLSIGKMTLQEPGDSAMISLQLDGVVNDLPLQVAGQWGPSAALLSWRDLKVDLAIVLGKLSLKARGSITDLKTFSGSDMHLDIHAPSARPLLALLGITEIGEGSLNLQAQLSDASPGMAIDVSGSLDKIDIRLNGKILDPVSLNGVELDFNFDGPSVSKVGAMFGLEGLDDGPYQASGELTRDDEGLALRRGVIRIGEGRLAIDGRLPQFPKIDDWELALEGKNFSLAILGAALGVHDLPEDSYDIEGAARSTLEGVELLDLKIRSPNTKLTLTGTVGDAPRYFDSSMTLELVGKKLSSLGPWLGFYTFPEVAFELSGALVFSAQGWQLNHAIFSSDGLNMALDGYADKLPEPSILGANFELSSPNIARLFNSYGGAVDSLPSVAVTLDGVISGAPGALKIEEMTVNSGASQLKLSGMLGDLLSHEAVDLAVALQSPDLIRFFPGNAEGETRLLPVDARGRVKLSDDGLGIKELSGSFGGATISLKGLFNLTPPFTNSNFSLQAEGPDLNLVLEPWLDRPESSALPFSLSTTARFDGTGLELSQLKATAAGASLSAKITMADLANPATTVGSLRLEGPSSLQLGKLLGLERDIPDANYSLVVGIESSNNSLQLDPITVRWGRGDLNGSATYRPGDIVTIETDLHSNFVNMSFLIPDYEELAKVDAQTKKEQAHDDSKKNLVSTPLNEEEMKERVISGEALNFKWLKTLQGSFRYKIDNIYLNDQTTSSAEVDFELAEGVLSSRRLVWNGSFASGGAGLRVSSLKQGAEVELTLDLNRIPLLLMLGGEPEYDPTASYRAHIKTTGESWQDFAKNANGALLFKAGGGKFENTSSGLIFGDFMDELLKRVNPFKETDRYTKIICHAGAVSIVNGKAEISPGVIIRSKKLDVAFGGEINLRDEKLDLTFNTRSRKGVGISAGKAITPYFKLGGTLANPRLVLDPKGVALSGSAAVATGGISILAEGLWDRWIATASNPCKKVVDNVSKGKNTSLKALLAASPVAAVVPTAAN